MESSSLPQHVLYYGTDAPPPAQIALRAGPLSLIYEAGDLRYIRLGQREILRRVYVALRDRNWGTVLPVLSNVQIEQTDDAFQISYDVEHRQGEIDFFWRGSIIGDARGTIRFTMDGVARSSFLRNRIGFCVLHPIHECAGAACRIEHVDGTVETTRFPHYIAPQALVDGSFTRCIRSPICARWRMKSSPACGPICASRARPSRWRISATGPTPPTRPTARRCACPSRLEVAQGTRIAQSVTLTLMDDDDDRTTNDQRPTTETNEAHSSFVLRPSSSGRAAAADRPGRRQPRPAAERRASWIGCGR